MSTVERTLSYREISRVAPTVDKRVTHHVLVSELQARLFKKHLRAMFGTKPKGRLAVLKDGLAFWWVHMQILLLAPRIMELGYFYDADDPIKRIQFHRTPEGRVILEFLPRIRGAER